MATTLKSLQVCSSANFSLKYLKAKRRGSLYRQVDRCAAGPGHKDAILLIDSIVCESSAAETLADLRSAQPSFVLSLSSGVARECEINSKGAAAGDSTPAGWLALAFLACWRLSRRASRPRYVTRSPLFFARECGLAGPEPERVPAVGSTYCISSERGLMNDRCPERRCPRRR